MTWGEVDLINRITVPLKTKKGSKRFPLNDTAVGILKFMALGKNVSPKAKVFPLGDHTAESVSVETKRAAKKTGMPEIHFHSLRHTFASWHVMGGTPLHVVQQLLGHKSIKQTGIYAHLSQKYVQEQIGGVFLRDDGGTMEGANLSLPVTSGHVN